MRRSVQSNAERSKRQQVRLRRRHTLPILLAAGLMATATGAISQESKPTLNPSITNTSAVSPQTKTKARSTTTHRTISYRRTNPSKVTHTNGSQSARMNRVPSRIIHIQMSDLRIDRRVPSFSRRRTKSYTGGGMM